MSMKNENIKSKIKKEQLLSEQTFLDYCNFDFISRGIGIKKLSQTIDSKFLRATEKDGFIKPLLKVREKIKQGEGTEKLEVVNYYSPHQIYIIAGLSRNIVQDDGFLWTPCSAEELAWYKKRQTRYVAWGDGSFWVKHYKKEKKWDDFSPNHFLICDYFYNFLTLLHSLEQTNELAHIKPERSRYFKSYPSLHFDFKPIEKGGQNLLKKYKLDIKKLNILRKNIGQYATHIDPLEHWYYYIDKHPQWRKDKFKGVALLAQDLYRIYDLITEIIEIITKEKQKPLFDFLYPNIQPMEISKTEYAGGCDVKAMESAIEKFKKWTKKKENKIFVNDKILKEVAVLEKELADYNKRYGSKSYTDGFMREIFPEENIKLEDLDEQSKQSVEETIKQYKNIQKDKNGKTHFITSSKEIIEKLNKREITLEEAKRKDLELQRKFEITMAIEHRLEDIQRDILGLFNEVYHNLNPEIQKAEEEYNSAEQKLWQGFHNSTPPTYKTLPDGRRGYSDEYQKLHRRFRDKELKRGLKKYQQRKDWIKKKQDELADIEWTGRLIFCSHCRKNPVQLHYKWGDRQVSNERICDECFRELNQKSLEADSEEWKNIKEGEWKCSCGKLLYKFAHNNTVAVKTINNVAIKIELEYGRNALEAKCPKCGKINQRFIDWGWLP